MIGTVKWFDEKKGFGFIVCADKSEVFVHHKQIKMEGFKVLHEGQKVEFTIKAGDKGPMAENVTFLN